MALVGVLAFLTLKRRAAPPPPRRVARLATALALATPLLLALHAAAWLVNASPDHTLGAEWATAALASGTGRVELWRTGLALLAAWALALARRPRLALPFALGALLVSGATGHSVAIHAAWAVPARAIHLAAAAPWIGGVLWLVACVGRVDRAAFVREALRVSAAALGGVVLVALSGVAQTLLFLPSPRDVVRSAYGAVALAKVAGLLVLVGFGAYHRYRVLPRLAADAATTGAFSRALRGELAVMTIVVLLGGLLAYVPPPTTPTP
jgi:putative copper export protein